jgi:hypothetical protein
MGLRQESQARRRRGLIAALVAVAGVLVVALPALAGGLRPNPANDKRLINKPIEGEQYDRATKCRDRTPPGMKALVEWLEKNVRGESWGVFRCEKLKGGGDNYSLHSESRALDWHLDAGVAKEKRAAYRLIDTLLADDQRDNPRALARRMGIQGLIFDCHAWWAGMEELGEYSYCFKRNGDIRHNLDRTQAHRDHIHIELNWDGAKKKTSFWRSPLG